MNDAVKFTFDTEFEDLDEAERQRRLRPVVDPADEPKHSDNQLAAAREESYGQGVEAGIQRAREEGEFIAANALTAISQEMARLNGVHETIVRDAHTESMRLALLIARKLAGEALSRFPVPEIESVIQDLLVQLGDITAEPKVIVRVDPSLASIVEQHIDDLKTQSEFDGQVSVIGQDGISGADCRVEWTEGGGERDTAKIDEEITGAVLRYIDSIEMRWQREVNREAGDGDASEAPVQTETLIPPAPEPEPTIEPGPQDSAPQAESLEMPPEAPVPTPEEQEAAVLDVLSGDEETDGDAVESGVDQPSIEEPDTEEFSAEPEAATFVDITQIQEGTTDLDASQSTAASGGQLPQVDEIPDVAGDSTPQDVSSLPWPTIQQDEPTEEINLDAPQTPESSAPAEETPPTATPEDSENHGA